MKQLKLGEALRTGQRVYGTLIVSPSPHWPQMVSTIGLDFVFIDTEHIPIDRQELSWMCRTYRAMNLAPLVRIPSPDPYQACMVLDGGACGVVAPYVETVAEVQELAGAVKMRPIKGKRLKQILSGQSSPEPVLAEYLSEQNADNVLVVNIESRPAMDCLGDILNVPGLDAVLVGPHDLSCSLGIPEQYANPAFLEAVDEIIRRAREHKVGVGIHLINPKTGLEQEICWARAGANLILHSADMIAVRDTLRSELELIKSALDDGRCAAEDGAINI
jgi:2-keto-3-deoxy-L-rhamnonate aldolase RhmA